MPNTRVFKTSFMGGEVSPEMYGHIDMPKEQSGLAECRNMWILPHGPAQNRPGFQFVNETKDSTKMSRLIPFIFSNDQSFAMEFGNLYIRLHTLGGMMTSNLLTNGTFRTDISGWTPVNTDASWYQGKLKNDGNNANLVTNGTFNSSLTGWTVSVSGTGSATWDSGTQSAKLMTGGVSGTAKITQTISATRNLYHFFRCTFSGGTAHLKITSPERGTIWNGDHLAGDFELLVNPSFTGSGSTTLTIEISVATGATRTAYVDNVEVVSSISTIKQSITLPATGLSCTLTIYSDPYVMISVYDDLSTVLASGQVPSSGSKQFTFTNTRTPLTVELISYLASPTTPAFVESAHLTYSTNPNAFEITTPYLEADLSDIRYAQSGDIITLVHPSYPPKQLKRLNNIDWILSDIQFVSQTAAPASCTATITQGHTAGLTLKDFKYCVTALDALGHEESVASPISTTVQNDLTFTGNYNTVTWAAVTGAGRYNVYKYQNGNFGYIGQTTSLSLIDDNILADMTQTLPLSDAVFGSAGNYPSAVGYHEQRIFFAGSNNEPQKVWATQSGTETNMNYSIPTRDGDALRFKIAAQRANYIRHLIPLNDLILMTASTEYRVFTAGGGPLTGTSMTIRPQSQNGCSSVAPVIVNKTAVYPQSQGGHLRELTYEWQAQGYSSKDLSLLATHLFNGNQIVDLAFSRTPHNTIWAVSSTGSLLGFTYLPDQEVAAWHQHTTDGVFESICVVAEGDKDVLYAIVKRTINGTEKRYVEFLHSRLFSSLSDAFFVDCGLTYNGASTSTITGLDHLEGKTVAVLADGNVQASKTVSSGSITLDAAATKVQVGIPYESHILTVPAIVQGGDSAFGQGRIKNINRVWARVTEFVGAKSGPDDTRLTAIKPLRYEVDGITPKMTNGEIKVLIPPNWNPDGAVEIKQDQPLPLTVVDLTVEVALGG